MGLWNTADAALVGAFTKAGLASAPPDYSKTFESVAWGYHNTMMASADMWSDVIMAGASMYDTYKRGKQNDEFGGSKGPDFSDFQTEYELNRKELGDLLQKDPSELTDRDKERIQDIGFSNNAMKGFADNNVANVPGFQEAMDNINPDIVLPYDMERALCVQNFLNGSGPTERGNYVRPRKDKKDNWAFEMYHSPDWFTAKDAKPLGTLKPGWHEQHEKFLEENPPSPLEGMEEEQDADWWEKEDLTEEEKNIRKRTKAEVGNDKYGGQPVSGLNGEKIRFQIGDLRKDIMSMQKDEGRALQQTMDGQVDAWSARGLNSPILSKADEHGLNDTIDDMIRVNGKRVWFIPSKYSSNEDGNSMSFFGEYAGLDASGKPTTTVASAQSYASLAAVLPRDKKGNLIPKGIVSGIEDVGAKGINFEDFQNPANYLRLTQAMFNPGDSNYDEKVTHKIFKEYKKQQIMNRVGNTWKGSDRNPINIKAKTNNNGEEIKFKSIPRSQMFEGESGASIGGQELEQFDNMKTKLNKRSTFGKGTMKYEWFKNPNIPGKGYYKHQGQIIPNKRSFIETFMRDPETNQNKTLLSNFMSLSPWYEDIADWDATKLPEFIKQNSNN